MTITPEAPTRTHHQLQDALTGNALAREIQVRTDPAGKPLALRHEGRIWVVDPDTDAQHWYARDSWWDTRRTAAVGSGDLVSVEYWRVQARLSSDTPLRTFTLHRQPLATQWLLESINDGA